MAATHTRDNTLVLFDVDGTLTMPRLKVDDETTAFVAQLREKVTVGIVGGSDLAKQQEQLGSNERDIRNQFDFVFSENGLLAYADGLEIHRTSIADRLGEEKVQEFVNFCLVYIATLRIPVKRGTFIEFRNGMINVSPIGRNCSQKEREDFNEYDKVHKVREKFVGALEARFPDYGLKYSIGGQISFDVFPIGWDKTYCLQFVADKFEHVYFFGDKTMPGGNDFEIFEHERTKGFAVESPADTIRLCTERFLVLIDGA